MKYILLVLVVCFLILSFNKASYPSENVNCEGIVSWKYDDSMHFTKESFDLKYTIYYGSLFSYQIDQWFEKDSLTNYCYEYFLDSIHSFFKRDHESFKFAGVVCFKRNIPFEETNIQPNRLYQILEGVDREVVLNEFYDKRIALSSSCHSIRKGGEFFKIGRFTFFNPKVCGDYAYNNVYENSLILT